MIPLFFVPWIPKKTLHLHWSPEPPQNIPRGGECLRIFRLRTANLSHLDDVGPWDSPKIPKLDGKNGVTVPKGYDFFGWDGTIIYYNLSRFWVVILLFFHAMVIYWDIIGRTTILLNREKMVLFSCWVADFIFSKWSIHHLGSLLVMFLFNAFFIVRGGKPKKKHGALGVQLL